MLAGNTAKNSLAPISHAQRPDESSKRRPCTRSTTPTRLPPRGTPRSPFPNAGMPGGRPVSLPAGAGLAVKVPALGAVVASTWTRAP